MSPLNPQLHPKYRLRSLIARRVLIVVFFVPALVVIALAGAALAMVALWDAVRNDWWGKGQ